MGAEQMALTGVNTAQKLFTSPSFLSRVQFSGLPGVSAPLSRAGPVFKPGFTEPLIPIGTA